jgi:hypothetical protein
MLLATIRQQGGFYERGIMQVLDLPETAKVEPHPRVFPVRPDGDSLSAMTELDVCEVKLLLS